MMATVEQVPKLAAGQRLSREEFLRRWEAMPDVKFAELIDGVVHMPSPVSQDHGDLDHMVGGWPMVYSSSTPGCRGTDNATWQLEERSAPQPDIAVYILPECGGQSRLEGRLAAGAPELAIEVSLSTTGEDLGRKLQLYQRCCVQEYLVVLGGRREARWHRLDGGAYRRLEPGDDGILRSEVFPGLWLDPAAMFDLDGGRLLAVLNEGLATPEHAEFVERLRAARGA